MKVNYKELSDRLALACMVAQQADMDHFKEILDEALEKVLQLFHKRHRDAETRNRIQSIISLYKRKCLEDFNKSHNPGT